MATEPYKRNVLRTWKKLKIKAMIPIDTRKTEIDEYEARRRIEAFCEFYK